MSMLDDLNELPATYTQPCGFQKIRLQDGDKRYREVMDLVAAADTTPRKRTILESHGYVISLTTIGTHVNRLCRQCL